jgi:endonuclease/exonuclease/phosphatase (EEP) superfamily protein YafD
MRKEKSPLRKFLEGSWAHELLLSVTILLIFVCGSLTILAYANKPNWVLNLAGHWQMQYFLVQVGCYLVLSATRHPRIKYVPLALAALSLAQIWPLVCPNQNTIIPAQATQARVRLLQMNVWKNNHDYGRALAFIDQSKPDIISAEELDKQWQLLLPPLLKTRGYAKIPQDKNTTEILTFSKFPSYWSSTPIFNASNREYIVTSLDINGARLDLATVHLVSPINDDQVVRQGKEFNELAVLRRRMSDNFLLVGDFNATSWTDGFNALLANTDLKDTRLGMGVQPSWPTYCPLFAIPIDHCLVSRHIALLGRTVGPDIGSDHYPVVVDLAIGK